MSMGKFPDVLPKLVDALVEVVFTDCHLTDTEFDGCDLRSADFHGSDIATVQGIESLKGIIVGPEQVPQLAEALLRDYGITVTGDT